jgi:hypothetical protein
MLTVQDFHRAGHRGGRANLVRLLVFMGWDAALLERFSLLDMAVLASAGVRR